MQFVRECFSNKESEPPVVIGGAVQGLLANNSSHVAGVSLFAAHMSGQHMIITEWAACLSDHSKPSCFKIACLHHAQEAAQAIRQNHANRNVSSLFLACHAGVELMPFHVSTSSLPKLTAAHWEALMQPAMTDPSKQQRTAALLLSAPHFIQVSCWSATSWAQQTCLAWVKAAVCLNASRTTFCCSIVTVANVPSLQVSCQVWT